MKFTGQYQLDFSILLYVVTLAIDSYHQVLDNNQEQWEIGRKGRREGKVGIVSKRMRGGLDQNTVWDSQRIKKKKNTKLKLLNKKDPSSAVS